MVVKRESVADHPRISNIDDGTLISARRVGKKCPASWRSENRVWTHDNSRKAEQSVEAVRGLLQTTRLPGLSGEECAQQRSSCCLGIVVRPSWLAGRSSERALQHKTRRT
jgi:hypothetical protein